MLRNPLSLLALILLGNMACTSEQDQNQTDPENQNGAARQKPNIVFILADDLGWMDVGCYGNNYYDTPNIDKLARQGTRFTNAYAACPVCSPTRASLMTGKYPARLHLTNYIVGTREKKGSSILPAKFEHHLPLDEVTIAEQLKKAGYLTGMTGKWHLGKNSEPCPWEPKDQGFDEQLGGRGSVRAYFYPRWSNIGRTEMIPGDTGDYITDNMTDWSLNFLEKHQDTSFFLYHSFYPVHAPFEGKDSLIGKYARKDIPENRNYEPTYAAMVESMDENVGRLLDKIEELGLEENTLVIFFSDNGGLAVAEAGPQPTDNHPLREGKGSIYEGGIREPLIMRWPGKIPAGQTSNKQVISNDFYPTLMEVAGLQPNTAAGDAVSFASFFEKQKMPQRDKPLFWHYPHFSNQHMAPAAAVRKGDYKLIEFYEDGRKELYNLAKDIGEDQDLSEEMPKKTQELYHTLDKWRQQVDANMPRKKQEAG